jgi:4-diphosphocytidyl-2-C-methyl-D-erythritol kinase
MNTTTNTASSLSEKAPAKINLQLKVTARRPDGYHELQISFLPLWELYDVIELEFRRGCLRVHCPGSDIPEDGDNLCGKAARAYGNASNIPPEWIFTIRKHIPVAAGLGGGSSDAAAVLRLLNRHYGALTEPELRTLAAGLGADVPFFLNPCPASATGIGENLTPFDFRLPDLPLLLVNPAFPVSAAWAYRNLDPARIGPGAPFRGGSLDEIAGQMQNDLEPAVLAKFPLLRLIWRAMLEQGAAAALMSGSGPTMFALCADAEHLARMRRYFESEFPFCRVFPFIFSA